MFAGYRLLDIVVNIHRCSFNITRCVLNPAEFPMITLLYTVNLILRIICATVGYFSSLWMENSAHAYIVYAIFLCLRREKIGQVFRIGTVDVLRACDACADMRTAYSV